MPEKIYQYFDSHLLPQNRLFLWLDCDQELQFQEQSTVYAKGPDSDCKQVADCLVKTFVVAGMKAATSYAAFSTIGKQAFHDDCTEDWLLELVPFPCRQLLKD